MDIDVASEPLGEGTNGPVFLRDIWPTQAEIQAAEAEAVQPEQYTSRYDARLRGPGRLARARGTGRRHLRMVGDSTYVQEPPYFEGMTMEPAAFEDVRGRARARPVRRQRDHRPHLARRRDQGRQPGRRLPDRERRGARPDFNSYGSRRGNHEVMMRGTFANVRFKNRLAGGKEGGFTTHQPSGEATTIYAAAMRYREEGVPTIVISGKEYGTGSSRDWAAKGPRLLGVRAVIAESYERIHRSNLVGMGVVPLQFTGRPVGRVARARRHRKVSPSRASPPAWRTGFAAGREVTVKAAKADGTGVEFPRAACASTPPRRSST